jgi:predicted ribosome quality control (RQC) complex YloA/Tae2 family protein
MTTEKIEDSQPAMFDNDEGKDIPAQETIAQEDSPAEDTQTEASPTTEAAPTALPPVAETPSPTVPETPTPNLADDTLRQQLVAAQQQAETLRLQQEQAQVQAQVQQRAQDSYNQYMAQGYTEEQSRYAAQQQMQSDQTYLQQHQVADAEKRNLEAKFYYAMKYGEEYGVKPSELMRYNDPVSMENAAKMDQRVQNLENENTRLKQGRVPAQSVDSASPTAESSPSRSRKLDSFNNGDYTPTSDAEWKEINRLIRESVI